MTTIFKTKELRCACERAAVSIEPGAYIPIMSALHITALDSNAEVLFYDTDINVQIVLPCENGGLDVVVNADQLVSALKQCSGKTVSLNETDDGLMITDSEYIVHLSKIVVEDLQLMEITIDCSNATAAFNWQSSNMRAVLNSLQPFISMEETRYYLNGVCLTACEGDVKAVATDGLTLRWNSVVAGMPGDDAWQAIVPTRVCRAAVALFRENDRSVGWAVDADKNRVQLVCGDTLITAKLIDGKYPNWPKVIPDHTEKDVLLRFNRGRMIAAMHKLMVLEKGGQFGVRFFNNGKQWCAGRSVGGDEAIVGLKVHQSQNQTTLEFGLNAKLLDRVLASLSGKTVVMRLSQDDLEATYRAPIALNSEDGGDGLAILMPMASCKKPAISSDYDAAPKEAAE